MFGASSGLFFVGARQCFVKSESPNLHRHPRKNKKNKPLHAPNLRRHQTKQTNKKITIPATIGPLLSSCWIFLFFGFFGACRCLVHLVVCFCFVWCLSMFVKSESPNLHRHQKQQKNYFFPGTMGPLRSSCRIFCFFWCLSMFGAFLFFCACQGFCKFHAKIMMKKHVLLRFWTLQMHKTAVFTVFYHHF